MNEKKVIAVIVEGPSDEAAIGGVLKEYFVSEEVQFAVVHGDITSDINTGPENAVKRVEELIDVLRGKYSYAWEDFLKIIHLSDTDGAFAGDCIVENKTDSIHYFEDHIETSKVEETEKRNKRKADVMHKLSTTSKVHEVSYRLYYNSCNLEHVLYGELKDFSDEEKERMSDDFADKYEGKVNDFIEYISNPEFAVQGTYRESWKYIEKDKNSLKRHTNMHMIFAEGRGNNENK